MLPVELHRHLHDRLVGQIVVDYDWPGCDPRVLAGCCGRLCQGVRWVRGNGHMLLLFDAPRFHDEPADLLLPVEGVTRVTGDWCGVWLWRNGTRNLRIGVMNPRRGKKGE